MGQGTAEDWRTEIETWRGLGATHVALNTIHNRGHLNAIAGTDAATHLKAIETYMTAVGDLF